MLDENLTNKKMLNHNPFFNQIYQNLNNLINNLLHFLKSFYAILQDH